MPDIRPKTRHNATDARRDFAANRAASGLRRRLRRHGQLYLLLLPAVLYFGVFHYYPLYGLQIAFKNYSVTQGIWGSPWLGLDYFERFFGSYQFWTLLRNTLLLSLYQLLLFPVSVLVALSLNELREGPFKRFVQTVICAPHFISVVVMVGILLTFLHPVSGIVNLIIQALGGQPLAFMTDPAWFRRVFVLSGEWQHLGWGALIYLAALASVDPQLHEAAVLDGATRVQRIRHIDLPGILPTIVILLILQLGSLLSVGFEKVYLLQNPLNLASSEVIQTYVYKAGLLGAQFSFSAAVGLFNSVVNLALLLSFNRLAKRVTGTGLW